MSIIVSLFAVFGLVGLAFILEFIGLRYFMGVVLPYFAALVFIGGFAYRIIEWAKVPVPFRIPTTCGQQETLPWIKQNKLENPSTFWQVVARMFLEVICFRSLFRNTRATAQEGPRLLYESNKMLWLVGLAFHYSFLVIFVRHFRLFIEPVPSLIGVIESLDGFVQLTLPAFYLTDAIIVGAVSYLFIRRVIFPQIKYISLPADFFPLLLILSIALSGMLMRYILKVDIVGVKTLVHGLVTFSIPEVIPTGGFTYIFYIHLFLVCSLLMYFPFSKLMHMGGVFMSPTRNLANNSRMVRHINPWNPEISIHTYMEYEDDFRDVMASVGLPLEKEPEAKKEE
ncbi:sulfate reduction electron transfer complex DsrMKJOP subunit DsrM [Nitrospirota bacterium]